MKRFTVLLVAVLVVFAMVGTAIAADFSGRWTNYKMTGQGEVLDFEELFGEHFTEENMGYVEFRDGKAYVLQTGRSAEDVQEMTYRAEGGKLIVDLPDQAKAEGISSMEFYFEGNELIYAATMGDDIYKFYYRRPQ